MLNIQPSGALRRMLNFNYLEKDEEDWTCTGLQALLILPTLTIRTFYYVTCSRNF